MYLRARDRERQRWRFHEPAHYIDEVNDALFDPRMSLSLELVVIVGLCDSTSSTHSM